MKVACIGDVHGTTKFLDAYVDITTNHNDIDKIIVFGDWFDPYDDINNDLMIERYNKAWDIIRKDDRCVCLIGNHDISGYVVNDGGTNRTIRYSEHARKIKDCILHNLEECYLVYRISNYLFSHAGVSKTWFDEVFTPNKENLFNELDLFQKGWEPSVLDNIAGYSSRDFSGYGSCKYQGPTWIRPDALAKDMMTGYNQVVGHTRLDEITNIKTKLDGMPDSPLKLDNDFWIVDNCQKPEYLILDINE